MKTYPKMYIWKRGAKIIDRWHITKEDIEKDKEVYSTAITPVMIKDKHGNVWSMTYNRCDLILRKDMVDEFNKAVNIIKK